jgi:hypothetical protein
MSAGVLLPDTAPSQASQLPQLIFGVAKKTVAELTLNNPPKPLW